MKKRIMSEAFLCELAGWAPRVAIGAAPSFYLAYDFGFDQRTSVAGMIAGCVLWPVALAWACVRISGSEFAPLVRALKIATWIKLSPVLIGGAYFLVVHLASRPAPVSGWDVIFLPDIFLGLLSLGLTGVVAKVFGAAHGVQLEHSFGWTALATMLHGAVTVGILAVIAFHVNLVIPKKLSPARTAD